MQALLTLCPVNALGLGSLEHQPTFDIQVIFETIGSFVDFVHWGKAGVSLGSEGPKGAVSGGEPGTTSRCLELLGGERN